MIGWFTAVATELNRAYAWPDGKVVGRGQIHAWHKRRTLNRAGQLPPSELPGRRFETSEWVEWARPGVPGPRRKGWVVPRAREGWEEPWRGFAAAAHQLPVRPRHRDPATGHWVITHPDRKPVMWPPVDSEVAS